MNTLVEANEIGLPTFFWADKLTPVNYYGHRSVVCDKFFEMAMNGPDMALRTIISTRFNALKLKCMAMFVEVGEGKQSRDVWDNRVVIECKTEQNNTIFVGFYDATYSIGLGRTGDNWVTAQPYKQIDHPDEVTN